MGHTKHSLRGILLTEFRKLLFSGEYYETPNTGPDERGIEIVGSAPLRDQEFQIKRGEDGSYIYTEHSKPRVEALIKDAQRHNWEGVLFHLSLEKETEFTFSIKEKSYKIA
jgi:hypothetical protein